MVFTLAHPLECCLSVRDRINELVPRYRHPPEYSEAMTKWRGLMRTFENLEERAAGKPPKRRKRRGNPSGDTSAEEAARQAGAAVS